jgi:hypothetical protein
LYRKAFYVKRFVRLRDVFSSNAKGTVIGLGAGILQVATAVVTQNLLRQGACSVCLIYVVQKGFKQLTSWNYTLKLILENKWHVQTWIRYLGTVSTEIASSRFAGTATKCTDILDDLTHYIIILQEGRNQAI